MPIPVVKNLRLAHDNYCNRMHPTVRWFQVGLNIRWHQVPQMRIIVSCFAALIVGALISTGVGADESVGDCSYDRAAMLALDQNSFDQDFNGGWRTIADRDGCKITAADLIRDYIRLNDNNATILIFHEAQMRAMAGQTSAAINLFKLTYKDKVSDRIGWNYYVDATIAFLERKKPALEDARKSLSGIPEPDGYNPVDVAGRPMKLIWPPNLNVIDGFINCYSMTYDEVFNGCVGPLFEQEPIESEVAGVAN